MGSSKMVDLGKQLEIDLDKGCWHVISDLNVSRIILRGNPRAMETTLEGALSILRLGRAG